MEDSSDTEDEKQLVSCWPPPSPDDNNDTEQDAILEDASSDKQGEETYPVYTDFEYIPTVYGGDQVIHQGHLYNKVCSKENSDGSISYECILRKRKKDGAMCYGRVRVLKGQLIIVRQHTHPVKDGAVQSAQIIAKVREMAITTKETAASIIALTLGSQPQEDSPGLPSRSNLRRLVKRLREPPMPHNSQDEQGTNTMEDSDNAEEISDTEIDGITEVTGNFEYISTARGGEQLTYAGHRYSRAFNHENVDGSVSYECVLRKKSKGAATCHGRVRVQNNQVLIQKPHTHPSNYGAVQVAQVLAQVREMAQTTVETTDNIIATTIHCQPKEVAFNLPSTDSIRRYIRKFRQTDKDQPSTPHTQQKGDTSGADAEDNLKEMILCWPPPSPEASKDSEPSTISKAASSVMLNKQSGYAKRAVSPRDDYTPPLTSVKRVKQESDIEGGADVALARWWRTHQRSLLDKSVVTPPGINAHTRLMHIVRIPEAQTFMWKEVSRLESYLNRHYDGDLPTVHHALGTMYERLGDCTKAYHHLHTALTLEPSDGEVAWVLERVLRKLKVAAAQVTAAFRLTKVLPRCLQPPRQVARRPANKLSYQDFLVTYAMTHTPVVITGLCDIITKTPWTLDYIRQMAGACRMRPRSMVQGSAEWARLEPGPEMTVSELISRVQHPTDFDLENPHYLFDWSLPLYCPQLAAHLTIPKYFAGDLLQRTSEGSLYRDSWPSLFVAPSGAVSELHVDTFGSNFWMALLRGKKRWVFFNPEDAPLLYPKYWHSLDPVFDVDLGDSDLELHPLLTLAKSQEVILQEGEVLFVPAGCPHRVENLTDSVAISSNFVDVSNLGGVRAELLAQSHVDPRAAELLAQLQDPDFETAPDMEQDHLTYEQFKAQGKS